jgi:DNA-binding LytR/AlgR family response regulator
MQNRFTCIIIEDELPASQVLELFISRLDFLDLKHSFTSATKAIHCLNEEHIDLIFSDINLPGISGIDFIRMLNPNTHVIFTTAHPEYAVESFELEVVDYLLKPVSFERFIKAVNRFLKLKRFEGEMVQVEKNTIPKERPFIFIKSDKKMVKVFFDEILYFEAQKNYLMVYTEDDAYKTYLSISEMEEKLPEENFLRIHRSFIISLDKIESFTSAFVGLGKKQIPIGRNYSQITQQVLKNLSKPLP